MGKNIRLILTLTCVLCLTSALSAQDDAAPETDKPTVTKQQKKQAQQVEKQKERLAGRVKRELSVELSEDQQKKLMDMIGEKREKLSEIQKEIDGIVGEENRKTVAATSKEARKAGKSRTEAMKAAWEKVGISEDDQTKIVDLNKQRNEIFKDIKGEIVAMFSDEQKSAMKAKMKKGKGKGKGKKGKKKPEGELTPVSVNLPGMTCAGCARAIRTALAEDTGFIDVETNVGDHSATFKVKSGFDFEAKLNEIAKNTKQVEGWSKN